MYAFKKSGIYGDYDVLDELDVVTYAESLPAVHEPIEDVSEFKKVSAQYFTPSNLKDGLTRSRENIKDVQGIIFDLDRVDNWHDLMSDFYEMLIKSKIEMYLWKTPSALALDGNHENGTRLYIPLGEPIRPELLPQAVEEVAKLLIIGDFNILNYGADIQSSKTIGRLMGLPLQKQDTIVPWDLENRKRYKIQAVLDKSISTFQSTSESDFVGAMSDEPTVENMTNFINNYTEKHDITFNVGERDNSLTRVFGALKKAFSNIDSDDLLDAFYEAGVAQTLDNPEKDIANKAKRLLK
ncbi:hypothetical protein JOC36_000833 [Weissella uvarum]|uniref:hypothetical protein n=2 Tax=Lactobacillaceae TaxID=33958 RepID=UPI00195F52F0|nr:hypothetical protein [Weissella uvarum]MBM7617284.1 hypothetical protein [Weissella uvarum]MCM0595213.1 hypothetical protein [Weissella uvarum]